MLLRQDQKYRKRSPAEVRESVIDRLFNKQVLISKAKKSLLEAKTLEVGQHLHKPKINAKSRKMSQNKLPIYSPKRYQKELSDRKFKRELAQELAQ